MPSHEYHGLKPYIGSSALVEMAKSPKHFHHALGSMNDPTSSQEKGTLIHSLLLEQDIGRYVARPLNEKGELVRSNSKEYAAFLADNPGKTPTHPDIYNEMYNMLTAFCENKKAMGMLRNAKVEHSVFGEDPETKLWIKARPDIWGKGYLADLKSTSAIENFENQIFRMRYDVRLIHYAKCIEFATGEMIREFYFIPFESSAPYESQIFQLSQGDVSAAQDQWREFMNQISVCTKTGVWPGYADTIRIAQKPRFLEPELVSFEEAM